MFTTLKVIGVTGVLAIAVVWLSMPIQPARACDEWPGGGLDEAQVKNLYSTNAPLSGRDSINPAAARALMDAWNAAGQPANFDASPFLKYGPDCEGGPGSASLANANPNNDNQANENEGNNKKKKNDNN